MAEEETGAVESAPVENVAPAPSTPEAPMYEPNTTEARMAEVFDRLNPQERVNRTETGKFESKAPIADQATDPVTEGQTQTETPAEPATPAIEAPQSMPAALRDKWGTVTPEVAEWVAKREAESHKRITELGETAKASEQIRQVVDRYRPSLRGVPDAQALDKLFAANEALERDPASGIQWLAQAYGVDLSRFAQQYAQEQQGEPESGHVRALQAEIADLKRQMADTSNRVLSREQREQEARLQTLAKLEDDFAKGKDYWPDIYEDVVDQVKSIMSREPSLAPEKVLEKAHERALKLRDDISSKLNEVAKKAEAEKAEAEKKRKADEAKKQASLNVRGTNATPAKKGSWEDTLRETANRIYG